MAVPLVGHMVSRIRGSEKARFLIVGGWNTVAGYLIFAVVHGMAGDVVAPLWTLSASYAISLPLAFLLQRRLVFQAGGAIGRQFARFAMSNSTIFAINLLTVPVAIALTGANALLVQGVFVLLAAVIGYFVCTSIIPSHAPIRPVSGART